MLLPVNLEGAVNRHGQDMLPLRYPVSISVVPMSYRNSALHSGLWL
jgi:hypothetical protein